MRKKRAAVEILVSSRLVRQFKIKFNKSCLWMKWNPEKLATWWLSTEQKKYLRFYACAVHQKVFRDIACAFFCIANKNFLNLLSRFRRQICLNVFLLFISTVQVSADELGEEFFIARRILIKISCYKFQNFFMCLKQKNILRSKLQTFYLNFRF